MQRWHVTFWFDAHPGLAAYLSAHLPNALKDAGALAPAIEAEAAPAGLRVNTTVVEENAYGAFVVGAERMRVALRSVGIGVPAVGYDFGQAVRIQQAQVYPARALRWKGGEAQTDPT
jgi:hypothetical protein